MMQTIQVLGTGCAKCTRLAANTERAIEQAGIDARVVKVREIAEMLTFETVSALPALAVDGRVRSCGRVLSVREIRAVIRSSPFRQPKDARRTPADDSEQSPKASAEQPFMKGYYT